MTNEDIERLKKKIEKDPQSALSIPLAEEYKKRGMTNEAISVLQNSIKNRPDYTSSRVALGKIYLNKDMFSEAREEFEKVISLTPDNLFAHKKLAALYCKQEELSKAIEECRIIMKLNPNDEDAKAMMLSLTHLEKKADNLPLVPGTQFKKEIIPDNHVNTSKDLLETTARNSVESPEEEKKEIPLYEIYESVNGAELGIEIPEKLTPVAEGPVSKELEEFRKIVASQKEMPSTPETAQKQPENENADRLHDSLSPAEETPKDRKNKTDFTHNNKDKIVISMSTKTMADIFITQGQYDKAMNVYKELLSSNPEDKQIIQRCKELKMLIKIKENKPR